MKPTQAPLFDAVSPLPLATPAIDPAFSRGTGRIPPRGSVFPVGDALADTEWQPFVETVIRVPRRTLLRSAATGLWSERGEVAIYVSSAAEFPAATWAGAIREHWGIENRNHWVRDATCDEDKSRIRNNPGIMARARSCTLNILRKNGVTNVAQALWAGAMNINTVLGYDAI